MQCDTFKSKYFTCATDVCKTSVEVQAGRRYIFIMSSWNYAIGPSIKGLPVVIDGHDQASSTY